MKYILVLNCGSSSIKFAIINPDNEQKILSGIVEAINSPHGKLLVKVVGDDSSYTSELGMVNYQQAMATIVKFIKNSNADYLASIVAIGHRVVHGGEKFKHSVLIDQSVIAEINNCVKLAPLHNPANLLGIEVASQYFAELRQVAVFDTAFHQTMPQHAYIYPLPYQLYDQHQLRRYGFHGTSHNYVANKSAKILNKSLKDLAIITAHLGNGCSAAAILHGKSVDTTMGLTPLEGLVMGSRSGDIDPAIPLLMMEQFNYSAKQVNDILNKQSGLLGISGSSMDMRKLTELATQGNQKAQLAIEIFCYKLAKSLAGLTVAVGKLDGLVFTGGIGENSALIREKTLNYLSALNFKLDKASNQLHGKSTNGLITETNSSPWAMVVATNEEAMIAQDTVKVLSAKQQWGNDA